MSWPKLKIHWLARWYVNRALNRSALEVAVFGTCHVLVQPRSSRFLSWLLGPVKYTFVHPFNEICQCDWKRPDLVQSLVRSK